MATSVTSSKSLVKYDSFGKFLQDVWLMSFLFLFIRVDTTIFFPFVWIGVLFLIATTVNLFFYKTGYQIAISVLVSSLFGLLAFLFGAPVWFCIVILVFSIWRIQERYSNIQEDLTHDGYFMTLLLVFFSLSYFLATIIRKPDVIRETILLAIIGLLLFILDRMIVQWMLSKQENRVPFYKLVLFYLGITSFAVIAFALIAGIPVKVSSPIAHESQKPEAQLGQIGEGNYSKSIDFGLDLPWLAILGSMILSGVIIFVWRLAKNKSQVEIVNEKHVEYERTQNKLLKVTKQNNLTWNYSMETNVIRDAYREFEKNATSFGYTRHQNETIREWFIREGWHVSERFYEIYDYVRYSKGLMKEQDGQWFIETLDQLSKKYFINEV